MDRQLDTLAKALANGMSRREAVRSLGGLLGAGLLAYFGIGCAPDGDPTGPESPIKTARPALAVAPTCTCNGATFDPTTQCCTSSGAVPKYPIQDLSLCPNRVPTTNPNYTPTANGCGAEGGRKFPNRWGLAKFKPACDAHDVCYGTCLIDKAICDEAFGEGLIAACEAAYGSFPRLLQRCKEVANSYLLGVLEGGASAYETAQKKACDCCSAATAGGTCGCSSGLTLCSGSCVNLSTDVNNCGSCGHLCASGQTCTSGVCSCPSGQTLCSGTCVNLSTDPQNCGSCGHACAGGEACTAGACAPSGGECAAGEGCPGDLPKCCPAAGDVSEFCCGATDSCCNSPISGTCCPSGSSCCSDQFGAGCCGGSTPQCCHARGGPFCCPAGTECTCTRDGIELGCCQPQ
jgi:hypothetical protein